MHPKSEARTLQLGRIPVLERGSGWTLDRLLANPDVVAQHFPADRYGPSEFSFHEDEFRRDPPGEVGCYGSDGTQARCPEVAFHVLRSYRTLLEVLGLYVDHHGWVYPLQRRGDRAKLEAAGADFLLPRVLRCLSLLELRGYSSGRSADRYGYSYAAGLATRLVELLHFRDDRCVLAAECFAVLRMA